MSKTCEQCGSSFESIGTHWSNGNCSYPMLTERQSEVVTGLLMGDGYINKGQQGEPCLTAYMTSPKYLEYIDDTFGVLGNGVKLETTAEKSAERNRARGFRPNAKEENYSDVYRWYSVRSPVFKEYESWYNSGKKIWPKDIEMTPTVLKHWYCGDGTYHTSGGKRVFEISIVKEIENTSKIDKYFKQAGLPEPSNYTSEKAEWTQEDSKELWRYMGKPLPGFEYKWPEDLR